LEGGGGKACGGGADFLRGMEEGILGLLTNEGACRGRFGGIDGVFVAPVV
jgi:hypothetical protein